MPVQETIVLMLDGGSNFANPQILGILKILERGKKFFRLMSFKDLARANTIIYTSGQKMGHIVKCYLLFLRFFKL